MAYEYENTAEAATKERSAMDKAVSATNDRLARCVKNVERLEGRLFPVLQPEDTTSDKTGVPEIVRSPLLRDIRSFEEVAGDIETRLESILSRLEL